MKRFIIQLALFTFGLPAIFSCNQNKKTEPADLKSTDFEKGTYGFDAAFLRKNLKHTIELKNAKGDNRILVSPEYQGRVMTSSSSGDSGTSFGWINYALVEAKQFKSHFNPVGGEERFWLGPEGGQYGLYFKKGDSFNLDHWQVPPVLDTLPFDLISSNDSSAAFKKQAILTNYSGNQFQLDISRSIRLLDSRRVGELLKLPIPDSIKTVAFETENKIQNTGKNAWTKETGLLSIWLLGMMTPTDQTMVIIPFNPLAHSRSLITDNYFGKISPERLKVTDSVLFFTCDGKSRSKIGISPLIARSLACSYDFQKNVLTVISFAVDPKGYYVNSKWEKQQRPFQGDAINSYNDGPQADGKQMGPFYEIESSSPARELKPGEIQSHEQLTCHFQSDYASMKAFTKSLIGVNLDELKKN